MTMSRRPPKHAATAIDCEEDMLRAIRALRRKCRVMRRVHDATGLPPLRRREAGFAGLVRIIVGQQLSVASANAIWGKCERVIKPMSARRVAQLDDDALREAGLSRPKIKTLRALAKAVTADGLDLTGMHGASDDEVYMALTSVSGIGPWTADIFMLACLGRPDAFAPGDLALQIAAQHAFELDERPTSHELVELAEKWRPWRSVSARLLWSYYQVVKDQKSGIPV